MAMTSPIKKAGTIKQAIKWLSKNQDDAYQLAYRIMCNTGLRVTDTTEIQWCNVNFEERTITIEENKGTRGNVARARLKVLEKWHKTLYQLESDNRELRDTLFMCKPKDLLANDIVPDKYLDVINSEIAQAVESAKPKVRIVDITQEIAVSLKQRMNKNKGRDDGFIFSKRVMKSNRSRGWHSIDESKLPVITRQAVLKAFKAMQAALAKQGTVIKAAAHGLRKTYARFLYESNGKDLNTVMQTMGWSDVTMVMRYLGYDEENRRTANKNAHTSMGL